MSSGEVPVRPRSAVPTFLVAEVAATARWYASELGFQMAGHVPPQEPLLYTSLLRDGAEIMLLNRDGYQKPDLTAVRPAGLCDAHIRMENVRGLYDEVRSRPFIMLPLRRQPYGDWEFEVRDPNGCVAVFGGDSHLGQSGAD